MRASRVLSSFIVLGLAASGCRRSPKSAAPDSRDVTVEARAPGDAGPAVAVQADAGLVDAATGDVVKQEGAPPDVAELDGVAEAVATADAAAPGDVSAEAVEAGEPAAPAAPDAFCPRPLGDNDNDAIWRELWLGPLRQLLRAHYRLGPDAEVTAMEPTVRVVATGEGAVVLALAYGIDRFGMWWGTLGEQEREAVEARVEAAKRREHDKCIADLPGGAENAEEDCAFWLDPETADPNVAETVWSGLGPVAPVSDCMADGLDVALFTGTLGAPGAIDPASLQLKGVATVELESRCNPEADRDGSRLVDVDHDGALEFVFTTGVSEEEGTDAWLRLPVELNVMRLDLTVQHHQVFPGIPGSYEEAERIVPQLWFRFEDRSGDGHPDLVVETFQYAGDCGNDPVPAPSLTGCDAVEEPDPYAVTVAEYPECVRRGDKIELRRTYDPARDGWRAPSAGG
ncbi:MAG: hypothetical protein HY905_16630 [Deltaproteobacteria bacterium]|nr:hypothetical protein [Deltaproteobacteria bacterium]